MISNVTVVSIITIMKTETESPRCQRKVHAQM